MAFGLNEIVLIVSLVGVALGYKYVKDSKSKRQVMAGGAAVAIFVLLFGGAFGYPAVLSAGVGPGVGPTAGALWDLAIDEADADSDTDRTETELESPDQHSLLWILADAQMDGLGDANVEVDIYNLNAGKTTDIWKGEATIVKVGTVIVSGIPTPVANYTTDRSRFAVTYAEGTTFTAGDVIQVHDKAIFSTTSLAAESMTLSMPIDPAVADDLPAGASFQLAYNVGGIVVTLTLQES